MRLRGFVALFSCLLAALVVASGAETRPLHVRVDRVTADRPDEAVGPQIHFVYAVPADGQDGALDTNGVIATWATNFNDWLAGQTGGVRLRFDTFQGQPDISFIRLKETDAALTSAGSSANQTILGELGAAGLADPGKKYMVLEQGGSSAACGLGGGPIAVAYLQASPLGYTCNNISWPMLIGHEIFHTLGAVSSCAPHYVGGHTTDTNDLMATYLPPSPVLDPGHDDYYGPSGDNHLPAGCPAEANVANSLFLTSHPFVRLSLSVTGDGTVTVDQGAGTDVNQCTSADACQVAVQQGVEVRLAAAADAGFHFAGWSGAGCSGTDDCVLTPGADTSVTATFSPDPYVTLKVKGKGRIQVADLDASCAKAKCAVQFPYGQRTTMRAVPAKGWRFLGWSGACKGTKATCAIAVKANAAATATFAARS